MASCTSTPPVAEDASRDLHSYANPSQVRVSHVELDLTADFERRNLSGTCTLTLAGEGTELVLDTRGLEIGGVEVADGDGYAPTEFSLGDSDPILGSPLKIRRGSADTVRIDYSTSPSASGLQWLEPRQTAGRKHPFLYTQSQAIHARSWIPVQDTPAVRVTYGAHIRVPPGLRAVMSAETASADAPSGNYRFRMPMAIPSYLIALAVGDLAFEPTGERTGVYAEPSVVRAAAKEFEDTEAMMRRVEELYGPYRWGRYDILVLPPAFPFGGMENPRLTFVSPTVIAGDKSLVSLIAHELAHSWSGNLATNATWRDFWLNEGFTVYIEERIQEAVYGPERAAMESSLEVAALKDEMDELAERDQILHVDLADRDPDDGFTGVPYIKGAMFLRTIEDKVGRDVFDPFLRSYFEEFAFRSVTTAQFAEYLERNLLASRPDVAGEVSLTEWLERPGLPAIRHEPVSDALEAVAKVAGQWVAGAILAREIDTSNWTTQHWLRFLRELPVELGADRLVELDDVFGLTGAGNAEILCEWLVLSTVNEYAAANGAVEEFLTTVGRRKFLRPLYEQLVKTEDGTVRAKAIYRKARPGYHPKAAQSIDRIVDWDVALSP